MWDVTQEMFLGIIFCQLIFIAFLLVIKDDQELKWSLWKTKQNKKPKTPVQLWSCAHTHEWNGGCKSDDDLNLHLTMWLELKGKAIHQMSRMGRKEKYRRKIFELPMASTIVHQAKISEFLIHHIYIIYLTGLKKTQGYYVLSTTKISNWMKLVFQLSL